MPKYPKKLIEVAMPLDDINKASAYEKMPGIGAHPRGIHHWWARRPLVAARAVLFAQLVNDPGGERGWYTGKSKEDANRERERLFDIIRDLVKWENTDNEEVLERARTEIRKSWAETCKITGEDPDTMPPFLDPFSGGGTIPIEAQRLGLESYGSDLNPVAVMIGKALIEIPPKFAGLPPVGPIPKNEEQNLPNKTWKGAEGLAEDVRRYGIWIREEAQKRIGHLYPKVKVIQEKDGIYRHINSEDLANPKVKIEELTVIAWLWARTIASPNPAYREISVPLVKSFWLCNKKGKEAWVSPNISEDGRSYQFEVKYGAPENVESINGGTQLSRGANFQCLMSGIPMPGEYIKNEGKSGRMSQKLMAIVAEGKRGRVYLSPTEEMEKIAESAKPIWLPEAPIGDDKRSMFTPLYGLTHFKHLFTNRQLVALTTLSDLVLEARQKAIKDAKEVGWIDDERGLSNDGQLATSYGDAISVYLTFAIDRAADFNNSLTGWRPGNEKIMGLFNRQAIPMVWDFGEANILAEVVGGFITHVKYQSQCLLKVYPFSQGKVFQSDACQNYGFYSPIISTDPPYYDNIGYADLSDFFYVWMRRTLKTSFPNIFSTVLVPKDEELIASPYRHGGNDAAEKFFLNGMTRAIQNMAINGHPAFPTTIYYAFKQSESDNQGVSSTGWETFLGAVLSAGFAITGTLPLRSEQNIRMLSIGTNALASSIVLVCRKREENASTIFRRQFLRELEETMPEALDIMVGGKGNISPIAPVDLAQAAIGPGMAVFSQYAAVLEMDGTPMTVRTALTLINKAIDEYFTQAEGDMDAKTRFCVDWFQTYGFKTGSFGEAQVLATAKGTAVDGIARSGVLESGGGKVRLYKVSEYPADWNPETDSNTSIWEACHQLSRSLKESETSAAELLARMPDKAEAIRQLAYRLYTLCERKGWAEDAGNYNELITSWHEVVETSQKTNVAEPQRDLPFA